MILNRFGTRHPEVRAERASKDGPRAFLILRGAQERAPQDDAMGCEWAASILNRDKGGAARRDKTLTAPCRFVEILAGKCGFAGQLERRFDGSNARGKGNAIPLLT